jgi:hypothetical protein
MIYLFLAYGFAVVLLGGFITYSLLQLRQRR